MRKQVEDRRGFSVEGGKGVCTKGGRVKSGNNLVTP